MRSPVIAIGNSAGVAPSKNDVHLDEHFPVDILPLAKCLSSEYYIKFVFIDSSSKIV